MRDFNRAVALSAVLALGGLAITPGCATDRKGDAIAGTEHVCSSCHGMEGRSVSSTFPRLAGQQKAYLVVQLKAFRDHSRADPHAHTYMWGMAARLSDETIEGLADYYSSQTPAPGSAGDAADIAAGEALYQQGDDSKGVPACSGCHGDQAQGGDAFPRIAGQHAAYLQLQLGAFAINSRANEIMHDNAKTMTADQMRQLAAYLASL